ncbi:hypothetical protein Bsph_p114 (plasmid) [Lysinibacillus sphaericus C3-41]|uniref:Uncharacterized protein n=2 Tax=Lysinibacillus sphaericus TaxID=1421 RepID=A0A6H0A151_LYSSH|nr:hypothetical protein [Lysinibacillus sphaericus]ACA42344.1 hypothetical protein Bsph_p114 [Lysinibacillus sphaericus C3-41]QIS31283.1 hypothetical protein [Lysinibacillus sphaericus]
MKAARWVWSRGKDGDNFKVLPIAITGGVILDIYKVIYGVGNTCGGYNQAKVVASKKEHVQGLLNEQEDESVLITLIEITTEDTSIYKHEQVLSIDIA